MGLSQSLLFILIIQYVSVVTVPVAARSKAQVCGRLPAEIVGSNPADDIDVFLLRLLCVVR